MNRRRPDVTALVLGLLFTLIAAGALFVAFGGPVNGDLVKVAVPLVLVAVGGLGLLLSRKNA